MQNSFKCKNNISLQMLKTIKQRINAYKMTGPEHTQKSDKQSVFDSFCPKSTPRTLVTELTLKQIVMSFVRIVHLQKICHPEHRILFLTCIELTEAWQNCEILNK